MANPSEFDPSEIALQHIVLTLVAVLARSRTNPETWIKGFQKAVAKAIDGWFPDGVPDELAAIYRSEAQIAAKAMLACVSPRPPQW